MSTENEKQENIAQTVAKLADAANPTAWLTGDEDVVALPLGWTYHDLERFMAAPRRHDINRKLATADGFVAYVTAHAIPTRTAVYVDNNSALGIIDDIDVTDGEPAWAGHKAQLALNKTPEWECWYAASGAFRGQREFIDFIQDRAGEIAAPPLGDLVQQLQAISAESSGSRRDAAGHLNSEMARQLQTRITNELPEYLELTMPVLRCEPAQTTQCRARLSVKLGEDGVSLAATLVNAELILDRRLREFVDRLRKELEKKAPVYF